MDINLLKEFPLTPNLFYLNHAAVSPWPQRTSDAVIQFAKENTQTGAQKYLTWLEKESHLREQLKTLISASSVDEIALLKNTSEALSIVAEGIDWRQGDNVVSSNQEFPSNRIPWLAQNKHGVEFKEIELESAETPETALINACNENTRLLSISSVQYGTGLKINLEVLGEFCRSQNIFFCVDAIQSLGAHSIDVEKCHIDFMMADAHKWLMGPEGIALFYCRKDKQNSLELRQFGWHMVENAGNYHEKNWVPANNAQRFECGSPNMLGIHALSASLSLINNVGIEQIRSAILEKTGFIIDSLKSSGYEIISPESHDRRSGIVTFKIKNVNMESLYERLMKRNLICAYRGGGVRLSPHFYTPLDKIKKSLDIINLTI